jgi:hypothetical protein
MPNKIKERHYNYSYISEQKEASSGIEHSLGRCDTAVSGCDIRISHQPRNCRLKQSFSGAFSLKRLSVRFWIGTIA